MIKIANNLQRLVKQASAQAAGAPQIMYSPELGGFHTPGTYPQSMLPEYYQDHQALGYINPQRFDEPEYFGNPEQLAMALNTSGVAETFPEENFQNINNDAKTQELLRKEFARGKTPADYNFDFMRGLATKAYQSHKRKPDQPAVMPAAEIMSRDRRHLNDYEKIQRQMAQQRWSPEGKSFLPYAAYDRSPDNPQGITAKNPVSDARVADLASKKVRDHIGNSR